MKKCARCDKYFDDSYPGLFPKGTLDIPRRHCDDCQIRNLSDGLGLPTPPCMLDKYTRRPTLTDEEYRRELSKPIPEGLLED